MKIFLVAGEASADMHAAAMLRELKAFLAVSCFGIGGVALRAEGMDIVVDSSRLNAVAADWTGRIGEIWASYRAILRTIREEKPDVAVLLDLPDFNLLLARKLKKLGVPVVYYISPQVWAWRRYRIKTIRRCVDKMLVLFPFEKEFYDNAGVEAEFVGHPLLDLVAARASWRAQAEILQAPRIALLPGSRKSEVALHAPILKTLSARLRVRYPKAQFRVPVASTLPLAEVQRQLGGDGIIVEQTPAQEILTWSDIAVVASGTATLETALVGTPFVLFYRMGSFSAWVFKHLTGYKGFLGMPNLLRNRQVVPEFFQEAASVENLLGETLKLIELEQHRKGMIHELLECRLAMGASGASRRAAVQIASVIAGIRKGAPVGLVEVPS